MAPPNFIQFSDSAARYLNAGWVREGQNEPARNTAMPYITPGRPEALPADFFIVFSFPPAPPPVLTGRYLVDMMPQPDLPSVEGHFVASGRQALPLVGVAKLESGDILGVAHAPLMSVPLDVLQHVHRAHHPPSLRTI